MTSIGRKLRNEITIADTQNKIGDGGARKAAMIYKRLPQHLGAAVLAVDQSVPKENGFDVWRILERVASTEKGDHCRRCGGVGHIGNDCPTPKGKGKENEGFKSKGSKEKGKVSNGKGSRGGKSRRQCRLRTLSEARTHYFAVLDAPH